MIICDDSNGYLEMKRTYSVPTDIISDILDVFPNNMIAIYDNNQVDIDKMIVFWLG